MNVYIGFDIGSTFTKRCIIDTDGNLVSLEMFATPISQKEYFRNNIETVKKQHNVKNVVSCGYGRENIGEYKTVPELIALSKGIGIYAPQIHTVLDIGGQDCKVIQCENGTLKRFFMNDKCAAGSGLFLQNALRILDMKFEELDVDTRTITPLSTVCAVFAQTEIIRRIAGGASAKELANAVVDAILKQAAGLLCKLKYEQSIAFTGGIAQICGADRHLAKIVGCEVYVPDNCTYLSAIGCAYLGKSELTEMRE